MTSMEQNSNNETSERSGGVYSNEDEPMTDKLIGHLKTGLTTAMMAKEFVLFRKQLRALLWKSWITRRVHWLSTYFEILGPVIIVFIVCLIYDKAIPEKSKTMNRAQFQNETLNRTQLEYDMPPEIYDEPVLQINFLKTFEIVYAPDSLQVRLALSYLNDSELKFEGLPDEKSIIEKIPTWKYDSSYQIRDVFAVYFDHIDLDGTIQYRLIYDTNPGTIARLNKAFPTKLKPGPVESYHRNYHQFVELCSYINRGYLQLLCETYKRDCVEYLKPIDINLMPYPTYKNVWFISRASAHDLAGLVVAISYVLVCPLIVKRICDEKSSKSKELLSMMGMSDLTYYSSHFISYFFILFFQAIIITALLFGYKIFVYSNIFLFFVGLLFFIMQVILFAILVTTIFNRPVIGVIVTIIIWVTATSLIFRFHMPSVQFDHFFDVSKANSWRIGTSFLPFSSVLWVFSIAGYYEINQDGLQFSNMAHNTSLYRSFSYLVLLSVMIGSMFVYFILIWYLDNVWPFKFGVPKSPFFFLKSSYWGKGDEADKTEVSDETDISLDTKVFELEPTNLRKGIKVKNLYKVFKSFTGSKKVAVNDLSFNIYENQVTVLLGHNGAGKTTTMNMITGMYNATSGSVHVDGHNVFTHTNLARQSIGLCPQENIFFNDLTVYQHLKLFGILKNAEMNKIDKEIDKLLVMLQLADKRHTSVTSLSGGMKRKLQLGMALIGKTKILILDEPSSGMDPEARRAIWNLLLTIRRERTILLTTHFMEEADILGDRIVIMNNGQIVCAGSSLFLKNSLGTGYMLRLAKLDGFKSDSFLKILHQYLPDSTLNSEMETEAIYQLEKVRSKQLTSNLAQLFNDIEKNKLSYRIDSYGMSYTSLEDVFLKAGADIHVDKTDKTTEHADAEVVRFTDNKDLLKGSSLFFNQCLGLFMKRSHFAIRYWPMFVLQILIPTLIIIGALLTDSAFRHKTETEDLSKVLDEGRLLDVKEMYGKSTKPFFYGNRSYYEAYKAVNMKISQENMNLLETSAIAKNVTNWLLVKSTADLSDYISNYLYGFGYNPNDVVPKRDRNHKNVKQNKRNPSAFQVWFNQEQYHSLPLAINSLYESLFWLVLPQEKRSSVAVKVVEIPFDFYLDKSKKRPVLDEMIISWIVTCLLLLPIAFPFLAASYILFPILEQTTKAKLIQLMTGLWPVTFWLVNFVFDLLQHLLAILVIYVVIYFFDVNHIFFGTDQTNSLSYALFFLLFSFGVSAIPLSYLLSHLFNSPSSGFMLMVIIYILAGLIANLAMSALSMLINFSYYEGISLIFFPILLNGLRLFPIFSLLFGYQKVYMLSCFGQMCKTYEKEKLHRECNSTEISKFMIGCCEDKCGDKCFNDMSPFATSELGCGMEIVFLFGSGLVFFVLTVSYETYRHQILKFFSSSEVVATVNVNEFLLGEDEDVLKESERVEREITGHRISDLLTVDKISKRFGNFNAVNQISFGVHNDELFGLLGVNGAGKTTIFSMLTGDLIPTSGGAYMKKGQISLNENTRMFQKNIGYCPQFDVLINNLNGIETLYLFARLRGVPVSNLARDVKNLIHMVGLEDHANRRVDDYSGGNRRKLSIAIAMIGNPSLLFLDEPTSGVDPAARRKIWELLRYIKKNFHSSIVLTSHSMEECEVLCARIAIMVNGKFRCLGSTQHLRTKYGQGYVLMVRLRSGQENDKEFVKQVQQNVEYQFPSARLNEVHQVVMHFQIIDAKETWSNIFARMEELNKRFDFEDYIVSDTTLEQIFITFARAQTIANTKKNK